MSNDRRTGTRRPVDRRASARLSAPGRLLAGDDISTADLIAADMPTGPLADYAKQHGLRPSAKRPPALQYMQQLMRRWSFIMAFATARNIAMYTEAKLGQLWQVLTPLLNAGVYYLIFSVLLDVSRGIPDYFSFLVTGVFVFNYTQRSFISSSNTITHSLPLIRALHFPRASLPLAMVMIELQQMMLAMGVLIVIVLIRGEPITIYWLLVIPIMILLTVFNIGVGLFVARVGSQVNDFSQLLPFLLRTWMYISGVMFSIYKLITRLPQSVVKLMELNPLALYITLMRNALLETQRKVQPGALPYNAEKCHEWAKYQNLSPHYSEANCAPLITTVHMWYYAIAWAVVALLIGFFFFWRAEAKYGRG
ncbi:MAG: ABC transporter permease [Streptosporangiaceae bacterium]|jgi:teichoic acid transport system permease protein